MRVARDDLRGAVFPGVVSPAALVALSAPRDDVPDGRFAGLAPDLAPDFAPPDLAPVVFFVVRVACDAAVLDLSDFADFVIAALGRGAALCCACRVDCPSDRAPGWPADALSDAPVVRWAAWPVGKCRG